MQCAQTPNARESRRQVEARTSDAVSGSAHSTKMAQILVCRLLELRADLWIERVMVWGSLRSDVGAPWGGRVQRSWIARLSRSALASSPEWSLARRRQCCLGATSNAGLSQLCVEACVGRVPSVCRQV